MVKPMSGYPRMSIREQAYLAQTIDDFSHEVDNLFDDMANEDKWAYAKTYTGLFLELKWLDLTSVIRESEHPHDPSG